MEKKTSSANRLALKRILGQDGNGRCADCKTASHPRWASWNIGILICIRCSGIHRSLGTHISKVRSIDLDTWNDVQLEKLLELGNFRANSFWEAKLPPNYVPDESKIVNFIKTKYELRRWVPDGSASASAAVAPKLPPKIREAPNASVDLLDLDGAFSMKIAKPSEPAKPTSTVSSQIVSIKASAPPKHSSTPPPSQSSRADVKKSILSLYSQPRQVNSGATFSTAPTTLLTTSRFEPEIRSETAEDADDNVANVWR